MSQSSYAEDNPIYGPDRARLNIPSTPYGAQLKASDSDGGWFKIDLLNTHVITAFAMQGYGSTGSAARVTSFLISSSNDDAAWLSVAHTHGSPKIFPGNTDNTGILKTTFSPPVIGRYFKITTKTCSVYCSFRLEIYCCVKI
ncbi:lactadherin isoform X2 [Nematostella vectensis]|nr:lactadherin isoform X2 [Nematostella vectensis]